MREDYGGYAGRLRRLCGKKKPWIGRYPMGPTNIQPLAFFLVDIAPMCFLLVMYLSVNEEHVAICVLGSLPMTLL